MKREDITQKVVDKWSRDWNKSLKKTYEKNFPDETPPEIKFTICKPEDIKSSTSAKKPTSKKEGT